MSDTDESSLVIVDHVGISTSVDDLSLLLDEPELVSEATTTAAATTTAKEASKTATTTTSTTASSRLPSTVTTTTTSRQTEVDPNQQSPRAIQIVSIGNDTDPYAFVYHDEIVQEIFDRIETVTSSSNHDSSNNNREIAIVSVVGAFRTGKSFLLSWFLQYLQYLQKTEQDATATTEIETKETKWYQEITSIGNDGFDWKAGSDRNTTGIWMWNQPFLIKNKVILLIDTQGMFDHETTMSLTTNIFGFSTLLSSYTIYNVDKRIQEDNLQQLALFSEYARLMTTTIPSSEEEEDADNDGINTSTGTDDDTFNLAKNTANPSSTNDKKSVTKPFQKIEFLVRDWQHFEDDMENDDDDETFNYDVVADSMMKYLNKVLAERDAKDLQDTREQILSCFDTISCFGLCHPGLAVTKKKYTGTIQDMDPIFVQLIVQYCERIFDVNNLPPSKTIHGRIITPDQLCVYIQAYAKIFTSSLSSSDGATSGSRSVGTINFPAATTMLEATAMANNTNALRSAITTYTSYMNRIAGPNATNYMKQEEFQMEHERSVQRSIQLFHNMANFGSKKKIQVTREQLIRDISSSFETYKAMNDSRNPLAGVEVYFFPVIVAAVSYIIRWFTDLTCSAQVCRATSELLSHIYIVVFLFLCIIAMTKAQQIKVYCTRIYNTLHVMMDSNNNSEITTKTKSD